MATLLYFVLSVISAEVTFLIVYSLTFQICCLFDLFLVALIGRKLASKAVIAGLLCGGIAGFASLRITYIFYRLSETTGAWFLVISLAFPVVGLFKYFQWMYRLVSTGISNAIPIVWRPHAAMMAMPQRYRFEMEKTYLEKAFPEKVGLADDPLGHTAYQATSLYLLGLTVSSFLGTAVGLYSAYRVMH